MSGFAPFLKSTEGLSHPQTFPIAPLMKYKGIKSGHFSSALVKVQLAAVGPVHQPIIPEPVSRVQRCLPENFTRPPPSIKGDILHTNTMLT